MRVYYVDIMRVPEGKEKREHLAELLIESDISREPTTADEFL